MAQNRTRRKPYREWKGKRLPPHVHVYYDRLGKIRNYFRRSKSKKVPFCAGIEPLSKEWWEGYLAAKAGNPQVAPQAEKLRIVPRSFDALIAEYKSRGWRKLKPKTQHNYGIYLGDTAEFFGDLPVTTLRRQDIESLLSSIAEDTPGAARNYWTVLSVLFNLAVDLGWRDDNPMRRIKRPELPNKDGFRTALEFEVARWRKVHADNPDALFLLNGLVAIGARSRSDFRLLGWKNIENGVVSFLPEKTRATTGEWVHLPIVDKHLLASLTTRPKEQTYFLANPNGDPWDETRLGKSFRRWANEAGWPKEAKMHGLRKLFATRMADRGASVLQIAAALGDTPESAMIYIRKRDQKSLAAQAVHLGAEKEVRMA